MAEAPAMKENLTAFVVGYTGEVGKELVKVLGSSTAFSNVTLIGRRQVQYEDPNLQKFEQVVIDFDKPEEHADAFKADVGFCCLGTTRGKAGADGFYKVDHDYVVNTAKLAKEGGCKHYSITTSKGSNKNSWVLYNKTKGEVEEDLKAMEFERLDIFRPGLLLCDREEKRGGESFFRAVLKPIYKTFPTSMSTPTSTVAKAMVNEAISKTRDNDGKCKIYEIKAIFDAAGEKPHS